MINVIDGYEEYLIHIKHASQNTVASYMRDVHQYAAYLNTVVSIDLLDVGRDTVNAYTH